MVVCFDSVRTDVRTGPVYGKLVNNVLGTTSTARVCCPTKLLTLPDLQVSYLMTYKFTW